VSITNHDLMNGQAVDGLRRGKFAEQWFEIR
jgi:hypothetical protein